METTDPGAPKRLGASAASPDVLAVVVTYNPGEELTANLRSLCAQIAQVVVVDNGSRNAGFVRQAASATGCELVANERNLGIAAALNQGAELALARGARWVATYDQDSLLPDGAIDALLAAYDAHPDRERIGVLAPAHLDRGTRRDYHHRLDILQQDSRYRVLRATITSGSMVRCEVAREIGSFDERLFIDAVDHDFCLRARRAGWLIVEARGVVMDHSIGESVPNDVLGVRLVASNHSALRRYYITRNTLEVSRRYFGFDPVWSLKVLLQILSATATIVVFERQRPAKLRAAARGLLDFARRRFGPYA